jgi:hypothetical protein
MALEIFLPLALGWLISPIGTADITAVDFNPLQLLLWISSIADYHCRCCCVRSDLYKSIEPMVLEIFFASGSWLAYKSHRDG